MAAIEDILYWPHFVKLCPHAPSLAVPFNQAVVVDVIQFICPFCGPVSIPAPGRIP